MLRLLSLASRASDERLAGRRGVSAILAELHAVGVDYPDLSAKVRPDLSSYLAFAIAPSSRAEGFLSHVTILLAILVTAQAPIICGRLPPVIVARRPRAMVCGSRPRNSASTLSLKGGYMETV